jgi:non-reducing end alpha-L-arabinofuranosidase
MYMVTGGLVDTGNPLSDNCCYDYGNVEAAENDTGAGHMDAIHFGTSLACGNPCNSHVPSVGADLENGIYGAKEVNPSNPGNNSRFVTAMLKNNGQTSYALKGGNSQSGGLTTFYNGALPSGYAPMHQEGSIVLGTGGDNSNRGIGSFFEGVITAGYPTDAADNAVQANIVAAGYGGYNSGPITGASGKCIDVDGDDTGGDGAAVQVFDCYSQAADQHWYHSADNTLVTLGKCLGTTGSGTTNGTQLQLSNCSGAGTQHWVQQANGSLLNVGSGRCIDDPLNNTTNGTRLQIWDCNGVVQQAWSIAAGSPVLGASGKCVDVAGDDTGGAGAAVQIWDCQWYGADQHWFHNGNGSLSTLGRCLGTVGGGTTNGTQLELANCSGSTNQQWTQQANGSLLNAGSGRCIDDPLNNTANGTRLQIWDCNGSVQQQFALH